MIGIVMTNKIQRGQAGRRIVELLRANAQLLRDLNNFRAENIPAADVLFSEEEVATIEAYHHTNNQELPDWLCCPISHGVLRDPVMLRGGAVFYERDALLAHIESSKNSRRAIAERNGTRYDGQIIEPSSGVNVFPYVIQNRKVRELLRDYYEKVIRDEQPAVVEVVEA